MESTPHEPAGGGRRLTAEKSQQVSEVLELSRDVEQTAAICRVSIYSVRRVANADLASKLARAHQAPPLDPDSTVIGFIPPTRDTYDLNPAERARLEQIRELRRLTGPAVERVANLD